MADAKRIKVLVSAFACQPNVGSEGGVGWRWAVELARTREVVVVTDITRKAAIEAELARAPIPSLRFEYFRPAWLRALPLNSLTANLLYLLWQFALLPFARRLHRRERFDLAMHLTYGVFRNPSFLGLLGVPFVFGPLGGGEDVPLRLKKSITGKEKFKEIARTLVNRLALLDPFLWLALARSTWIFTKTEDTRQALPWPFRRRAKVMPEIGIEAKPVQPSQRMQGDPLKVLFAGRLLGWKGAHLALRAVAAARAQGVPAELTIVGKGPFGPTLVALSKSLGLTQGLHWVSHIPQAQLWELMQQSHVFLFPSLHDSSGNVVLEAQSCGLPVVCLDRGGPATLVDQKSAIVVDTDRCDEAEVVVRLASALVMIAGDEPYRQRLAAGGLHNAAGSSWHGRVEALMTELGPLAGGGTAEVAQ